jgi:hypothetical protein
MRMMELFVEEGGEVGDERARCGGGRGGGACAAARIVLRVACVASLRFIGFISETAFQYL